MQAIVKVSCTRESSWYLLREPPLLTPGASRHRQIISLIALFSFLQAIAIKS